MPQTETPTRRSERSRRAEAAFRARLAELGATLLEPAWLGAGKAHRVRCVNGHECLPRPAMVASGRGVCRRCPGARSDTAAAKFRARLAELGVTLVDVEWRGCAEYYRAICPKGHECAYSPNQLSRGRGGCQTCGMERTIAARMTKAEAAFRARLTEVGATLLDGGDYLGSETRHRAVCSAGHECSPRPVDVARGANVCRICAQRDPHAAEQAFRQRLADLGATLLEAKWFGNKVPHRVICAAGHECRPMPNHAMRYGICLKCRGRDTNAFYVLTNEDAELLKFGITSGDGRRRFADHAADGFTTVHRLLTELPDGVAPALERHVIATLKLAGERPVRGREYFPDRARALVLDVVDNYPTSQPSDTRKVSA
ncbi:hypothetical protein ABTY98_05210 [Streptomyces sp. NPDC096040]|uniref:hypothetical protein n=1 Tax=Streptomyces sp. NPDC096040 TaxID=3155541 RepID=UPI0033273EC4